MVPFPQSMTLIQTPPDPSQLNPSRPDTAPHPPFHPTVSACRGPEGSSEYLVSSQVSSECPFAWQQHQPQQLRPQPRQCAHAQAQRRDQKYKWNRDQEKQEQIWKQTPSQGQNMRNDSSFRDPPLLPLHFSLLPPSSHSSPYSPIFLNQPNTYHIQGNKPSVHLQHHHHQPKQQQQQLQQQPRQRQQKPMYHRRQVSECVQKINQIYERIQHSQLHQSIIREQHNLTLPQLFAKEGDAPKPDSRSPELGYLNVFNDYFSQDQLDHSDNDVEAQYSTDDDHSEMEGEEEKGGQAQKKDDIQSNMENTQ
ncbi:hypothetical protein BCR41DRAFT_6350 [Lobosporangium transversale]|uniref:Uncharacterized protein n=1 Tax=Lobosporangium transversale TaxID=64571 RepID=A0A1Y2H2M2_9FUNG|nr:hypothetical protein BCR41DRAFT_6350 [Lobosporangium transversale]ORZ28829.1 hypothetical protein BCR41DRAFT_6350 [Lobosporangium transversale]|eukprot:XP_021886502.1 hypothetical protein BCR41DRAFT_6350 [Lobosporangium transversale]